MHFPLGFRRAQDATALPAVAPPAPPRRLGLALGGGSALGWAHIGIIQEFVARGITIDAIAGTSIGALVGACYAADKLDDLEAFARGLNRRQVFGFVDLSFAGSGLIGGARLKRRLTRDLGGLAIESLPTRFAAVATELGTGHEVALTSGDLIDAVRASYALPGIFEPVLIGDRWLFDGALSNPVPVSVCRSLGADFVVAVNLTAGLPGQVDGPETKLTLDPSLTALDSIATGIALEEGTQGLPRHMMRAHRLLFSRRRLFTRRLNGAPGIAGVMVGAFTIAQERISRSRLALDPPDVMLNARLAHAGLFDFHRAADLIDHGRGVARRAIPNIEMHLSRSRTPG